MSEIKIDSEVLEKLWKGELCIAEKCCPRDKEYRRMLYELNKIHTQLLGVIGENSRVGKLLECYEQQIPTVVENKIGSIPEKVCSLLFARHGRALTGVSPEHAQMVESVYS